MVIRELLIKLGLNGGAQVNRELDKVDGGVNKTMQSFSALGSVMAGVFAGLTISNIVKTADTMQSLESRIGMLPQTVGDVGEAFDEVAKRATENRMSVEAYAEVYTRIGNAAQDYVKTSGDLEKVTTTLSQALVVGGATAQEQASAFLQFSQALGSGTLQGDEFRAMAEAAPQYLDQLAKSLGYPRGELKKLASEGKLTTKEVIQATMQMSDYFNQKFKQIPLTINQSLVMVSNRWSMFIRRVSRDSGAVTWVASKILWLSQKAEFGLERITEALGGYTQALKLAGIVLVAAFSPAIIYGFGKALQWLMLTPGGRLLWLLTGIGLVLEDIFVWMNNGKSVIGRLLGPFKELGSNWHKTVTQMKKEFWGLFGTDSFEGLLGQFDKLLDRLSARFEAWFRGLWVGLYNMLPDSIKSFLNGIGVTAPVRAQEPAPASKNRQERQAAISNQFSNAGAVLGSLVSPKVKPDSLFNPGGVSYGQVAPKSVQQKIEYKPMVSLSFSNTTASADDVEKAVNKAMGKQARTFIDAMGDNMNFNTGG